MIFTGGIKVEPIKSNKEYELNRYNQYVIDDYYRIKGESCVFAIGDVAQILDGDVPIPPTAQSAEQSGSTVAKISPG